jgi:glutathione S-transferase
VWTDLRPQAHWLLEDIMQLYTFVGSPNGRKVEAVIAHVGLDVEIVHLDFPAGLRAAEYLALNPNAMTPTLVDDDFTLTESNAIMQYIAEKAGDHSVLPREARAHADVTRWQFWESAHFNRAFGALAFEVVAKPLLGLGPEDADLVRGATESLGRFAPVLERRVANRAFLVGNAVTVADYTVATFEGYRTRVPFDFAPFPGINAYFDRIHALEPWQQSAPPSTRGPTLIEIAA